MSRVTVTRLKEVGEATIGRMDVEGLDFPLWTLEDLWQNNHPRVSCVPAGTYPCIPHAWEDDSPAHIKRVWQVLNVPGREAILIHAGNTDKDTLGCILVGKAEAGSTITNSREAIDILRAVLGSNPFTLTIIDMPRSLPAYNERANPHG